VPDYTQYYAQQPLLPRRASQKSDYDLVRQLKEEQAQYVHALSTTTKSHCAVATERDLAIANNVIRQETRKLNIIDAKLKIHETVLNHVAKVAFNEIRLGTDVPINNDTEVQRAIVTFQQARMLVDAVEREDIIKKNKLIVDISKLTAWGKQHECYLLLDVFETSTMQVQKRQFRTQKVQIKYFEASWPGALVAHRIEPLLGSTHAHTKKKG